MPSASGGLRPLTPDQGLCPWTQLGAPPPDPHIGSRSRACHILSVPVLFLTGNEPCIQTAGTWHEMAIELTQEIGRRITTITEDNRETTFLFQRLSMALQRRNAVSFHNTMIKEYIAVATIILYV